MTRSVYLFVNNAHTWILRDDETVDNVPCTKHVVGNPQSCATILLGESGLSDILNRARTPTQW